MCLSVIFSTAYVRKNLIFEGFLTNSTNNLTNEQELPYL